MHFYKHISSVSILDHNNTAAKSLINIVRPDSINPYQWQKLDLKQKTKYNNAYKTIQIAKYYITQYRLKF